MISSHDKRWSPIADCQHQAFFGDRRSIRYVEEQEEAEAYGRRLAWFLNSLKFSLGAYPELYVLFTQSLAAGEVELAEGPHEWWHRYVHVGVPGGVFESPEAYSILTNGITDALIAVRPDQADTIRGAEAVVREHGSRLRFMIRRRETKNLVIEITSNIEAWPRPSQLFISHTDKATGIYREADPIDLGYYFESLALSRGIRLQDAANLKEVSSRAMVSQPVNLHAVL